MGYSPYIKKVNSYGLETAPFTLRYPGRLSPASGWLAPPKAGEPQGERVKKIAVSCCSVRGEVSNHERIAAS
jgi:hypothetical protein